VASQCSYVGETPAPGTGTGLVPPLRAATVHVPSIRAVQSSYLMYLSIADAGVKCPSVKLSHVSHAKPDSPCLSVRQRGREDERAEHTGRVKGLQGGPGFETDPHISIIVDLDLDPSDKPAMSVHTIQYSSSRVCF
jgi:hypothetical protein